jgi:hypothetical protein
VFFHGLFTKIKPHFNASLIHLPLEWDQVELAAAGKGAVMKHRIDVPVSIGGVWSWLNGQPMLRLDLGLLVHGKSLHELATSLLEVLDDSPHDLGVLVNVGGCNLPLEKMLLSLDAVRTHTRTRAMAVLTVPYEGALRDESADGLAFFWQECDALEWLSDKLYA